MKISRNIVSGPKSNN